MRIFIAFPVPDHIAVNLADIGMALKDSCRGVKPVHKHGIHLTLAFLGDQNEERVEKLKSLIMDEFCSHRTFQVCLSKIGTFPPNVVPKVIWAGVGEGAEALIEYQDVLMKLLVKNGFPEADEKRPFHPHLTIARNRFTPIPRSILDGFSLAPGAFKITRCVLYQSTLQPSGAEYTELAVKEFL